MYPSSSLNHHYRNANLSRLGNPCCPGFSNRERQAGTKGPPFCPGSGNRDNRLVTPTGTKGAASATWLAHPFIPVASILFLFQLYFCISIKLMYWNSVCMISTNIYTYIYIFIYICIYIYIYIYSYLYNICPR